MKVNIPESHKIISTKDESVPLFQNRILDVFSRVSWYVPLVIFIPAIIFLGYRYFTFPNTSVLKFVLLTLAGIGIWTLVEYALHRFLFHIEPTGPRTKRLHFLMHGVHHAYPSDSKRLVMPPVVSIPLATIFFLLFYVIFGYMVNAVFFGFLIGYLAYDMLHYATHHANFIKASWFKKIQEHHMRHHYLDPNSGFGVSSKVWDKVMHTDFEKKSSKKS